MDVQKSLDFARYVVENTSSYYITTLEVLSSEYTSNLWIAIVAAIFFFAGIFVAAIAAFRKIRIMFELGRRFEKREMMGMIYLRACDLAKTARIGKNSKACVHLTHKFNLDVNQIVAQCGMTIFQCACIGGDSHLIKHFLSQGAIVFKRTKSNDSTFYLAVFGHLQSKNTDFKALKMLLNSGCKVTDVNAQGFTPLHIAAYHGDVKLTEFLLQQGADISKRTHSGIYPIDCAISAGRSEVYDLLRTSQ